MDTAKIADIKSGKRGPGPVTMKYQKAEDPTKTPSYSGSFQVPASEASYFVTVTNKGDDKKSG